MRALSLIAFAVGVAAVLVGVVIEGTAESPAALFLPFLFVTGALDLDRKRRDPWVRLALVPIVFGASAAGVAWTLGPEHAASTTAGLVWVGLAVCIAASVEARAARKQTATLS